MTRHRVEMLDKYKHLAIFQLVIRRLAIGCLRVESKVIRTPVMVQREALHCCFINASAKSLCMHICINDILTGVRVFCCR